MTNAQAGNSRKRYAPPPNDTGGTVDDLQQFKAVFEHASVGMAIITLDGHFTSVNYALCNLLGYTQTELYGKQLSELLPPAEAATSQADVQNMLAGDTAMNRAQKHCMRKNGQVVWVELTITLLCDAQQRPQYFVAQLQDIDQWKRTEEAIRDSEEKLRAIYEGSNDAVMLLNEQGFFDCNPRTLEMFGFKSKDAFTAAHPADVSPPLQPDGQNSLAGAQERIQTAYQQGYNRFEWVHRRTTGEDFPAEVLLSAFDFGGQRVLQATVRDITQRQRLEQQIRESLERRGRQVQTSTEVAQDIAAAPDLNELFQRVVTLIKERFNYYHVQIFRDTPDGDRLVLVNGYGSAGEKMLAAGHQIPIGQGLVGTAAAGGESVLAADVAQARHWHPNQHLPHTRGELAVPIKSRDRVLGVLDVQSDQAGALSEEDRLLLEGLCGQIAIAIENRQVEETLRRNEVQLSEALRIARLANWEYDVQTDTFTFNDQFYALLRTTAEREGGYLMSSRQYAQRFVHPEDAPLVGQEIEKALTTTDPNYSGHVDHRIIYADGETGYITVRFTIEKDAQGRTIRTRGANQDITERQRSQEQLRVLTSAVEAAATGIAITNRDGQIEWINPAFTRLTGYTREEAIGQNPRVLKSGKMPVEFYRNMWRTISAGQVWRGELINRHKDGTDYSEEMTITPVRALNGEILHYIAVKQDVSERKRTEEALLEERNLIRTLIDALPDRIYAKDLASRFTLANATEIRLDGAKSFEDLRGKSDFDFYPRELAEQYIAAEQPVLRDGQSLLNYEEHSVDQAGNATWHLSSKVPLRNSRGEITGLVGMTRDITASKLAEEALALERNRLRTLIDSLPHSVFIKDRDSRFLVNNTAHLKVLGAQSQDEVLGKNDYEFFPHDLASQYYADEQALMEAGQPIYDKEETVREQTSGQLRIASSTKVPLKNARGEVIGFVGFSQDITERKHTEEALKSQAVFWQHLIDTIPSPIFFKDVHGVYQGCNVAFEKYLGRTRDQIIGLSVFDMAPKDLAEKYHAMDKVLFDQPGTQVYESQVQYADGTRHNVIFNKATTLSLDGSASGLVGIIQDITERKQAEETLRRSQEQLAEALRIAQLANWEYDVLTDTFTFNDQFYALLRTTAEREGGYQMSSMEYARRFVHPEDAPIVGAEVQQAIAATDPHYSRQLDHRIIYADGTPGYISVRFQIEKDASGRTVRTHGANQDITERKRAEETLRRATEGLHAIFWRATVNQLDDPNAGTGGYGWTTEFSNLDAVSDFLPLPELPDSTIVDRFFNCWLEEDRPAMDRRSTAALRQGLDGYSQEFRLRDAHGNIHWMYDDARIRRMNEQQFEVIGFMTDITERKLAEEALRSSESELAEALKIAKLAYWEYDVDKDLFLFNDQFYALFHTTAQAHGGYQLSSAYYAQHFVYPEDLPIVGAEIERALTSTDRHYSRALEHRIQYADGGVGYISVNINIDRDERGKILRYYGANQDITARKQAEQALRRSEAELAEALKIAKLAYWEYDVEKDMFVFNDQFFAIFHTTAEKHGGYQLSSAYYAQHFVFPDDLPVVGAEIEKALNSTDRHYNRLLEHRIQYADGGIGHISVNINIDRDEQGRILRYYGANQDITERKSAEEARKEIEERFRIIAETTPVPIVISAQADGMVLYGNEQAGQTFGIPLEQLVGRPMPDFYFDPADRPILVERVRQERGVTDYELHVKRADGTPFWVLLNMQPLLFAGQAALFTAFYDITERKLAEQALRHSQEQLAEALRIAQLANWEYDVPTDTFTFNDQFYALFHTTAEREGGYQMSSMRYAQRFVHPEDAPLVGQTIQKALETSDPTYRGQVDHRIIYADGQLGFITARFAIGEMADGRPVKTYGANQDITAQKLAEAEREQLLAQQQRRTLQLQTAAEVSRAAASILDPDELIAAAVELVRERFGLYYVGIFMTDEVSHWAELRAGTGEAGRKMLARKHRLQVGGQSMIGWCIANGRARIALDVGDEAVRFENPLLPLTRSEMALPLISRGVTIGAATVQSTEPNAFSAEDITALQTMADQLTIAVTNAQLFEQTRQTVGELDALTRRLTGEAWNTYTRQKGGEQAVIWHSSDEQLSPVTQSDLAKLAEGEVITQLVNAEEHVTIPIALRGQLIGALRFRVPAQRWTDNAQNMATSIAGHLAQAVENARLIEQTQWTAARERQIATAADRIHRATDLDRVLQAALEEISRITGAQDVGIQLGAPSTELTDHGNGHRSPAGSATDQIEPLAEMGGSHA